MIDHSLFFQQLQARDDAGSLSYARYRKLNGIWFNMDRVLLDPTSELCKTIFHGHHAAPGAGHSSYHRALRRIKLTFWWPGLKNYIRQDIRECDTCQKNKGENMPPPGLLSPLPILENVWESISMDFIEGLPVSHGMTVVMVIVDRYTKFAHLHFNILIMPPR